MNERIAIDSIFAMNMSSGPNHDFVMKGVVMLFLASAKTKHATALVPNNDYRQGLNP